MKLKFLCLQGERAVNDAYEQEFEQLLMARMEEQMHQFVDQRRGDRSRRGTDDEQLENPFGDGDGSSSDEQQEIPPRLRVNIPEFDGDTLNPEGFIDWLITVEEVFEFKEVHENKKVSLIATRLCGRASTWWHCGEPKCGRFIFSAITRGSFGSGNVASHFVPISQERVEVDNVADDNYEEAPIFYDDPQYEEEVVTADVGVNLMVRRSFLTPKAIGDDGLKHNLFQSTYTILGKVLNFVIDSDSCDNLDRFSVGEYNNLSAKMIGPVEIVEKINSNAYRLKLPSHIRCSDVFNLKHLLAYHGDSSYDISVNSSTNPVFEDEFEIRDDVDFEVGDFMWAVLTKDCFSLPSHIWCSDVFNVKHLLPYHGVSSDDISVNSRANFVYSGGMICPSVEEHAILFMEAQNRLASELKFLIKMPPKRRVANDVYEQEFEQRLMARMEERMCQFITLTPSKPNELVNKPSGTLLTLSQFEDELEIGDDVDFEVDRFSVGEYNNLSAKMIGPVEIVEKLNSNAYRLKLPSHIRCSDVFNVKHLLPYHGYSSDDISVNSSTNPMFEDELEIGNDMDFEVEKINSNAYRLKLPSHIRWLPYHGDSSDDISMNSRANFVYSGGMIRPSVEEHAILFMEA
ncbi:reverse transcriptase domain-containing protein [Artemisia annua]|uniref:Reverse transcriptase domain-containing protein n=1 Tax=Artemisia annua TaxID=35608 RepID=A0A2U1LSM0_ARTAN|nr:reverse transcriptase domain-containing protein [Artemisia annua]